jgi:hypothetical protein
MAYIHSMDMHHHIALPFGERHIHTTATLTTNSQAARAARASARVVLSATVRFFVTTFRASPSLLSDVSPVVAVSSVSLP